MNDIENTPLGEFKKRGRRHFDARWLNPGFSQGE